MFTFVQRYNLHEHMFQCTSVLAKHQVWTHRINKTHRRPNQRAAGTLFTANRFLAKQLVVYYPLPRKEGPFLSSEQKSVCTTEPWKCGNESTVVMRGPYFVSVPWRPNFFFLRSFGKLDHLLAVQDTTGTTLIADDKSRSRWRIRVPALPNGSSGRNNAAFCFCSKAFCLWLQDEKKL